MLMYHFYIYEQLAETESAKLELMDRMEDLEDELKNLQSQLQSDSTQELTRVIQEKNQVSNLCTVL